MPRRFGRRDEAASLLVVDNYDSFTWNLVHYLEELGAEVRVELNDRIGVREALAGEYDGVLISPGPGRPREAGISVELARAAAGRLPLLGVCLGHQALAVAFGARIVRAAALVHGKSTPIDHAATALFRGLPRPLAAARYHSLTVDPASVGPELLVEARAPDGTIMGLRHRRFPLFGVQFHPESVLMPQGKLLLANFLEVVRSARSGHRRPARAARAVAHRGE